MDVDAIGIESRLIIRLNIFFVIPNFPSTSTTGQQTCASVDRIVKRLVHGSLHRLTHVGSDASAFSVYSVTPKQLVVININATISMFLF